AEKYMNGYFFVTNGIFLNIKSKYLTISEIYTTMLKKYHRGIDRLTDIVYNDISETIDFFSCFLHTYDRNAYM
nr:hypothetical protein [Ruminococcus sp.]